MHLKKTRNLLFLLDITTYKQTHLRARMLPVNIPGKSCAIIDCLHGKYD